MHGPVRDELPIVDELRSIWLQRPRGNFGEQGDAFHVPMSAETGRYEVQIAVVVAGMAAEFEGPVRRQSVQNLAKSLGIKAARRGDADASVSRQDTCVSDMRMAFEVTLKTPQSCNLETPHKAAVPETHAPRLLERLADCPNGAAFCNL